MATWCYNDLIITAPNQLELERFLERVRDGKRKFCFSSIAPMPEELRSTNTGGGYIDGQKYNEWRTVNGKDVPLSEAEREACLAKYGASNWRDWTIKNWGTKWDLPSEEVRLTKRSLAEVLIKFKTAWDPPTRFLDKLSELFPDFHFTLEFGCEGETESTFLEWGPKLEQ